MATGLTSPPRPRPLPCLANPPSPAVLQDDSVDKGHHARDLCVRPPYLNAGFSEPPLNKASSVALLANAPNHGSPVAHEEAFGNSGDSGRRKVHVSVVPGVCKQDLRDAEVGQR